MFKGTSGRAIVILALAVGLGLGWTVAITTQTVRAAEEMKPGVRLHRTALINSGKSEEAVAWARSITEYANATYPDVSVEVYSEIFGTPARIHWFADYKDLATYQSVSQKISADPEWNRRLDQAADLFSDTQDTGLLRLP